MRYPAGEPEERAGAGRCGLSGGDGRGDGQQETRGEEQGDKDTRTHGVYGEHKEALLPVPQCRTYNATWSTGLWPVPVACGHARLRRAARVAWRAGADAGK